MNNNKIIALDTMGSDLGPLTAWKAAYKFCKLNRDYEVWLFSEQDYYDEFKKSNYGLPNMKFINSMDQMTNEDLPIAIRNKKTSSMYKAFDSLKMGNVQALVSAGSSGAFLLGASLFLKKINDSFTPAFMTILPSFIDNKTIFLDLGANLNVQPKTLEGFGLIGSIFMQSYFGISQPTISILSNGAEATKGLELQKEAYKLMSTNSKLNFLGNIEARDLLNTKSNVIVADGWSGNIALKSIEGSGSVLGKELKNTFKTKNIFVLFAGLILKRRMKKISYKYDYRTTGGAFVIGFDGICIKAHGSSDVKAFFGALNQAKNAIEKQTVLKMKEFLNG